MTEIAKRSPHHAHAVRRVFPWRVASFLVACLCAGATVCAAPTNLVHDSSFEHSAPRNQFGQVFPEWQGWKYGGDCEFRVGQVARTGETSCLIFGAAQPKIRMYRTCKALAVGRYRITAYLRGLDIGEGQWGQTTEFAFNGKYMPLKKGGTFGWTPLTYVTDVTESKDVNGPSFGLMAPGYLWIDDVSMVQVGQDVALTPTPILGEEEAPIEPPGPIPHPASRCPQCGYRNHAVWGTCYACGTKLAASRQIASTPPVKVIASFEDGSPFSSGTVVDGAGTDGTRALRIDKGYASWDGAQDWSGYDYLLADTYVSGDEATSLYIEIRDRETQGYWTRVNYSTLLPPGQSRLIIPLEQLYVGEKSRPGRNVQLDGITRFVLSIGDTPTGALCVDNIRLERDVETAQKTFDGLYAFDFGKSQSPLMPGFTRIASSTTYSAGRGYGLKDARVWRSYDVLQPDPLYQDFICIERGGMAVDLPNGRYHVFLNMDSPSGYWGEYQKYRERTVTSEGNEVVKDTLTLAEFKRRYYRFWDQDDLPSDDTFTKYQDPYYDEKRFEVDVTDGQLNIDFTGSDWACSVSAIVIYPASKAAKGERFLEYVVNRRRFFFENYFRRVLHRAEGDPLAPSKAEEKRGYVVFSRDYMQPVYYNDTPLKAEIGKGLTAAAFPGEYEPTALSMVPLRDLGKVSVSASRLTGPGGDLPADAVEIGYVSYRLARTAMDGSVYTIAPRLVMPTAVVEAGKGITRRFWLTLRAPRNTPPGLYKGTVTITPERAPAVTLPLTLRVYRGQLAEADIPVGPWGHTIDLPWYGNDPATAAWNDAIARKSLQMLRRHGFTSFSGAPQLRYRGFKDGAPVIDFGAGDRRMAMARAEGFDMPIVNYTPFIGLNMYYKDETAMKKADFSDYSTFVHAIFSNVQSHAEANNWLPVYWNLGDEPVGNDLVRAAENAEAYRKAFPVGPPYFTAATSFHSASKDDGHYRFGKAVHVGNFNTHNEESIALIHDADGEWSFYNGGSRWTYGIYMYKAAKQFDMKFRLSWHWNVVAGDPYYALDCREDDYAWCNTTPDGELVRSLRFERKMREGLDDYRYMLTLASLAEQHDDAPAKALIDERLNAFKLGQRNHDELFPLSDWGSFRASMAAAIERMSP